MAAEVARGDLEAENAALRAENAALADEVARLTRKITELEHRMARSSRNSSMPPSADSIRYKAAATKDRAARRAEAKAARKDEIARRRGKQAGARGQNLDRRAVPDEVVTHEPDACESCGTDLSNAPVEGVECRQVFDTPAPVPLSVVEHRSVARRCACQKVTKGRFPKEARATTCYGPNVRAAALYLLHRQHLPVERTAEALSALFGAPVSAGFVSSLTAEAAARLVEAGFMEEIGRRLRSADVVHADETTDQVGTARWWFHVVSNHLYTHLFASPTRGRTAPDEVGILGDFTGVMVHDRLSMYFTYDKATHAICLAHVIRELADVGVRWDQGWANDMTALLTEMNKAAHAARADGLARLPRRRLKDFLARYDAVTAAGIAANPTPAHRKRDAVEKESFNLVTALQKLRAEATRFVCDLSVPMTNNQAERDLRMVKLHKKISGCFQSDDGAKSFATIRSYISTAHKHEVNVLDALTALFHGDVWMPPVVT